MSSSQHPLDQYKVPRERVNVEDIAQQLARYMQIAAEDTEFLSLDPTRRDRLVAEFNSQAGVKPGIAPEGFVPFGSDPDMHLIPANAEIERLTPPRSFEDRVVRCHIAIAALMVFNHYKVRYALLDHRDLEAQVQRRMTAIMDEWQKTVFRRIFPKRTRGIRAAAPSTPPVRSSPMTPPPTHHSLRPVSGAGEDIEDFLRSPHTLVGKKFTRDPPDGEDGGDRGMWEVVSYTVRKVDTGIDHEYHVMFEVLGGAIIPMDTAEVRELLRHSRLEM